MTVVEASNLICLFQAAVIESTNKGKQSYAERGLAGKLLEAICPDATKTDIRILLSRLE